MEEMDLRAPPTEDDPRFAPVDLALDPRRMQLRHKRLTNLPERHAAPAHVAANLPLRHLRAVLSTRRCHTRRAV